MDDEVKIEAGESRGGVTYLVKRTPNGMFFYITTEVGGQLPAVFDGFFTGPDKAQAVIDSYLAEKKPNATRKRR